MLPLIVALTTCQLAAGSPDMGTKASSIPSSSIDCTSLPSEMQEFASQLSESNRLAFCNLFDDQQRNMAIELSSQPDSTGAMMSADDAVQKVAKDENVTLPQGAQSSKKSGGACPVD